MINLFNLFLFLFAFWVALIFINGHFSWLYLSFGLLACFIVSFVSWKIKIINKNSEFSFLNISFYKHFFGIIFLSLFKSIILAIKLAFDGQNMNPVIYRMKIKNDLDINPTLLINSINLMPGLICLGIMDKKIIIHALDEKYLRKNKFKKLLNNLYQIKDEGLV